MRSSSGFTRLKRCTRRSGRTSPQAHRPRSSPRDSRSARTALASDASIAAGFAAREVFNSTMSVVYAVESDDDENLDPLRDKLISERRPDGKPVYSPLVCISLLVFFFRNGGGLHRKLTKPEPHKERCRQRIGGHRSAHRHRDLLLRSGNNDAADHS